MRVLIGADKRHRGYEEQAAKGVSVPLLLGEPPLPNSGTVDPSSIGHRCEFPSSHHSQGGSEYQYSRDPSIDYERTGSGGGGKVPGIAPAEPEEPPCRAAQGREEATHHSG
uniref:Uncharacterized protein n=1 Tax=Arundo donax TaxID=35708 RepID=A0A0A9F6L3_ARUDO